MENMVSGYQVVEIQTNSGPKVVNVKKVRTMDAPFVLKFLKEVFASSQLNFTKEIQRIIGEGHSLTDADRVRSMVITAADMLEAHYNSVVDILSRLTDATVEEINETDLDEGVALLVAVMMVNIDFFINRVMPVLDRATETMEKNLPQSPPQKSESKPVTAPVRQPPPARRKNPPVQRKR